MPEIPTQQPPAQEAARIAAEAAQVRQRVVVAPAAGTEALRGVQVSLDLRQ